MNANQLEKFDQTNVLLQSSLSLHTNQLAEKTKKLNQLVDVSKLDITSSKLVSQSVEASKLTAALEFSDIFKKLSEQTKEMSRLINVPRFDTTSSKFIGQSIQASRLAALELSNASKIISAQTKEINKLIDTTRLDSTFAPLVSQSLDARKLIDSPRIADIKNQLAMTSSLARTLNIESLAQISLSTLKLNSLGESLFIPQARLSSILGNFQQFSNAYSNLMRFGDDIVDRDLPRQLIIEQPALEVLESISFLESISDSTSDQQLEAEKSLGRDELLAEIESIEVILGEIDEGLLTMWKGAIEALKSQHQDYARHCSVSLRELLTHVIHKLSPDNEIQKWTNDPNLFADGRPTRKARLLFICRAVNHDVFADFIHKDIMAILEFFSLFQRGTHQINIPYTPKQLLTLKNKVESTIVYLIQTHRLNF